MALLPLQPGFNPWPGELISHIKPLHAVAKKKKKVEIHDFGQNSKEVGELLNFFSLNKLEKKLKKKIKRQRIY